jgi:hypothetical protein
MQAQEHMLKAFTKRFFVRGGRGALFDWTGEDADLQPSHDGSIERTDSFPASFCSTVTASLCCARSRQYLNREKMSHTNPTPFGMQ